MATIATVSLEGLPKSRLIELLHSLGQKNEENASFISRTVNKWNEEMSPKPNPIQTSKSKRKEEFQMSRYRQRTVAIQLQYDGGSYFGFSSQPGEYDETIEKHLFEALHKLKFIDSRQVLTLIIYISCMSLHTD